MASKIGDRFQQVRKFAQAAAKHADSNVTVRAEPLKQTKLLNGVLVASIENHSPNTKIGVFLRAGSRYETSENLGITHVLRNSLGLSTRTSTIFGITRNIDYHGGLLNATTTRDNFVYQLENIRDKNFDTVKYLIDSISRPAFKHWELEDNLYRLKLDVERHQLDAQSQLADCLHRAAYRGGLSNPLLIQSFNIGKRTQEQLFDFTKNYFTSNDAVVVGLGVDHEQLVDLVQKEIELSTMTNSEPNKSKYIGGDCRLPFGSKLTFATVVTEGVPLKNKKEVLVLDLFAQMLGTTSRVKHSNGAGKLQQAVQQIAKEPFKIGALNKSYLDTGLFGFTSICDGKETKEIIKLSVATVKKTAKDFNETDLKIGKTKLKSALFDCVEDQSSLLECLGTEGSLTGQVTSSEEIEKLIDSISVQDVTSLATKIVKGKPSIAAVGHLDNMPYAEDLAN